MMGQIWAFDRREIRCKMTLSLEKTMFKLVSFVALLSFAFTSCESCVQEPTSDASSDGGADVAIVDRQDASEQTGGEDVIAVIGECNENTPTFGDECGACGTVVCDPATQELTCLDPGLNDCEQCGDIDESAGRAGESCGEFGCGVVLCNAEGTATECFGDREPNACGGCQDLPLGRSPDDVCSGCNTGTETCTRDQNSLVCVEGREPALLDESCDRRVFAHAFMDERLGGGYIRNGTLAVFENINDAFGQDAMSFAPLVEGPGTRGLVLAHFFLTPGPEINIVPAVANDCVTNGCPVGFDCVADIGTSCVEGRLIFERFAADLTGTPADPVRQFPVTEFTVLNSSYMILYDWFLQETISVGQVVPGAPEGFPLEAMPRSRPDAGPMPDASLPDAANGVDAGMPDAGNNDVMP